MFLTNVGISSIENFLAHLHIFSKPYQTVHFWRLVLMLLTHMYSEVLWPKKNMGAKFREKKDFDGYQENCARTLSLHVCVSQLEKGDRETAVILIYICCD